jgi:hypothetical protein
LVSIYSPIWGKLPKILYIKITMPAEHTFLLDSLSTLELHHVKAGLSTYRGQRAVRLVEDEDQPAAEHAFAVLLGSDFKDGVIQAEVVGMRRPDAPPEMRGFVGIAFRVHPGGSRFECFFLRPDNARADDQLRRNHSTQYISHPDYPWYRLRDEAPGVYESYTDLVPGEWTKVKIVVSGARAKLYVNEAEQPCLVVNDLKLGETSGQIALWIGSGTEAYFSKIIVS